MIVIFALLIGLGCLQALFWIAQQRRTVQLHRSESSSARPALQQFIARHAVGRRINTFLTDVRAHLVGRHRRVQLIHLAVVLVVQIVTAYLNQMYIQLELYIVLPIVFPLTLYALYLRSKKVMRQQFEAAFSEALNVINSSLRAGNSVIQGIEQCGQKLTGIVGEEFRQIAQRLEIGEDPENVFIDSWGRLPYREYYFFIITVLINMKGGGQVREVMARLGVMVSNNRIMERKKYAMTSEARMSVKILAFIPVAFFALMNIQSPDSVDVLLHHPVGQILFYYSVGSILFGLLVVWMMMNKI
ncbi:MAG TPA: type II secretion system F family protein [Enterobacteriaceae bacterium]|nr:type II secretion system F family protein [Enterobacteriaceae bacterium]